MASLPTLPVTLTPALSGRDAVADALYRLVGGLDSNDATLFDSAFTSTATFALRDKEVQGLPAIRANSFDIVETLDTSHLVTNVRVNIADSGVKAAATASVLAQHFRGGKGMDPEQPRLLAGAQYYADVVKEESGLWKIEALRIKLTWSEGDWAVIYGN